MSVRPGKMMIKRSVLVMIVLILSLSLVSTGSLVRIMIINGEKYQRDASEQQLYDSLISAPRGDIYTTVICRFWLPALLLGRFT